MFNINQVQDYCTNCGQANNNITCWLCGEKSNQQGLGNGQIRAVKADLSHVYPTDGSIPQAKVKSASKPKRKYQVINTNYKDRYYVNK